MKNLGFLLTLVTGGARKRNLKVLLVLVGIFVALVTIFSTMFHWLMAREDQSHSWPTSVYWTLVTMTTLGFGDITFHSDAGRLFSVVVLLSGTVFLLILLPFSFIQFVFVPWMAFREAGRAPRLLPAKTSGHVVLTQTGPIEDALIRRADLAGVPYVLMVGDLGEALKLHDRGYRVMVGNLDDPQTYVNARVDRAALVTATRTDMTNANIAFTVRETAPHVPLVATASKVASVDNLQLAGADAVLLLGDMLGAAMAARALANDGSSHQIGEFAGMRIAEARVVSEQLVGKTLVDAALRREIGIGVLGLWAKGRFQIAFPDTVLEDGSVVILGGSPEQLADFDRRFAIPSQRGERSIVIGGGRVGRAAARALIAAGNTARIVEQRAERILDDELYVLGDAADIEILEAAGLDEASSVLITTHDDDVNIYLALYCRRLQPDLRVVARANRDRNVSTLYRAGADDVLSYASTGSAAIWNHFRGDETLLIADGLEVFRVPVPPRLAGIALADSRLRKLTGCNVVAISSGDTTVGNPPPSTVLAAGDQLILIGDDDAEERFAEHFHRRRLTLLRSTEDEPVEPAQVGTPS